MEINEQQKKVDIRTIKSDKFHQTFIRITDLPVPEGTEINSFNCEDCVVDVDQEGNVLGVTFTLWHEITEPEPE